MAKETKNHRFVKKLRNSFPGYPESKPSEDITAQRDAVVNVDPNVLDKDLKKKLAGKGPDFIAEEEAYLAHKPDEDLDVPGAADDDANEAIGEEDEENNYYSLGGGDNDDLDNGHEPETDAPERE